MPPRFRKGPYLDPSPKAAESIPSDFLKRACAISSKSTLGSSTSTQRILARIRCGRDSLLARRDAAHRCSRCATSRGTSPWTYFKLMSATPICFVTMQVPACCEFRQQVKPNQERNCYVEAIPTFHRSECRRVAGAG